LAFFWQYILTLAVQEAFLDARSNERTQQDKQTCLFVSLSLRWSLTLRAILVRENRTSNLRVQRTNYIQFTKYLIKYYYYYYY